MDKQTLINRLCFANTMIVASIPLLRLAIESSDGVLREYFRRHLDEEKGHDAILKDDLKRLGVDKPSIVVDAAEISGLQYYLILHWNPASLLGYMAALERESLSVAAICELENEHGVRMECLRLHSKLDAKHIYDLDMQIAKLPAELRAIVRENERHVTERINRHFEQVENG